jgi:hypothetical protein
MFDFLFGGEKKLSLIRELLEQRMRRAGFDQMEYRLEVKRLGKIQILGTPEAAVVTIVETLIKMVKQEVPAFQIIESIENHRKNLGHNASEFREIINIAKSEDFGPSLFQYCRYRMSLEHNSLLTPLEVDYVASNAFEEIRQW